MAEPRATTDGNPTAAPRGGPRRDTRRVMFVGFGVFACSVVLVLLPLALGRSSLNRYFVAFGFVGVCLGLSCVLHGTWDWARGRSGDAK